MDTYWPIQWGKYLVSHYLIFYLLILPSHSSPLCGQLDVGVCRNVQREAFIGSDGSFVNKSIYKNVIYTNIERFCDRKLATAVNDRTLPRNI